MNTSDDRRWDEALLAAGFEVDPDARLTGRPAAELVDDDAELADPWRDVDVAAAGLTPEQRSYVDTTSPALGGALPSQTLTGDDPLGDVDAATVRDADSDVIDFD